MHLKSFLLNTSLLGGLALLPINAHAANLNTDNSDTLSPRAEVSVKGGTERSILTTEFWAPLAQQSGKVFYGDLRLMGDNDDNREGNLGFGYRQVSEATNSVIGGHIWIDRRRTDNNNTFHQITIGAESLGTVIDLRANGYIALNGEKTAVTPNLGSTTPYLAGNGVFIDTAGRITETAQHGADAEIGYRLPILQRYTDTIRIYGGGYDFFGNGTDNLIGYRVRTEAQVNSAVSVGARFQHDNQRGDQGFLEATLRFPFSAKKLYQKKGLYGRLDESPERDVDIVTSSKKTSGLMTPLTNTSGTAQRVLYVDNSNANTGDGSYENPFNTLKAAEVALKANDILYVKAGNGTTTGMDQGINITQSGISLIGSGSALTVDGYTLINAGIAPKITNIQTYVDDSVTNTFTGNGIFVTGADASISGVTVNGTQGNSIYALMLDGSHWNSFTVANSTATNSVNANGIYVKEYSGTISGKNFYGGSIDNVTLTNNTVKNIYIDMTGSAIGASHIGNVTTIANTSANGIGAVAQGINADIGNFSVLDSMSYNDISATSRNGALIDNILFNNLVVVNSGGNGISFGASAGGTINTATLSNATIANSFNSGFGVFVRTGGVLNTLNLQNISSTNNREYGIYISPDTSNGKIGTVNGSNITVTGNTSSGMTILATALGSMVGQVNLNNVTAISNGGNGVSFEAYGAVISSVNLTNITSLNNSVYGIYAYANNRGTIGQFNLDSAVTRNNLSGVSVFASGTNAVIGQANINNVISNNNAQNGVIIRANTGGMISQASVTNSSATLNRVNGIYATTDNAGIIDSVVFNNNIANANTSWGLLVFSTDASSRINNATVSNSNAANNLSSGIRTVATASGLIGNLTVSGNTSSNSTVHGFVIAATAGGTITNAVVQNNTGTNNAQMGMLVGSSITGSTIGSSVFSGNTMTGNAQYGFEFTNDTTSSLSSSFYNNTATNNTLNGLYLLKSGTGTFVFDAGGGALGSIGGNKILNNTGTEVRIDGGYALQAQSNYWGGGDLSGGERTLNGGSTITTTGFLTVDPRP